MPKRMNARLHQMLLEAVIARDGDICLLCRKTKFNSRERTLDHLDNKKRNNALSNLHLLCRGCNTGERNRNPKSERLLTLKTLAYYLARLPAPGNQVTECVSVKEREQGEPRSPYRAGFTSSEEQANFMMEPTYRKWLFDQVKRDGSITKDTATAGGAEYLEKKIGRGSPATTERYFTKTISREGWLSEGRDEFGRVVWGFRDSVDVEKLGASLGAKIPGVK